MLVDLAVTLADGGEAISDIAGLADQPDESDSTSGALTQGFVQDQG